MILQVTLDKAAIYILLLHNSISIMHTQKAQKKKNPDIVKFRFVYLTKGKISQLLNCNNLRRYEPQYLYTICHENQARPAI